MTVHGLQARSTVHGLVRTDDLEVPMPRAGMPAVPELRAAAQPHLALLGADATDADIDGFVAALLAGGTEARHLPGQHNQKSHAGGTLSPVDDPKLPRSGAFATSDPTKMANLPPEHQAALRARLAETVPGLTDAKMDENLDAVLKRGLEDPDSAKGAEWYDQANRTARGIAAENPGMSVEQAAAGIAATSPQHEWGSNVAVAGYTAKALRENPEIPDLSAPCTKRVPDPDRPPGSKKTIAVTKTYEEWARDEITRKGVTPPETLKGRKLSEFDPTTQAALIKAMGTSGTWGTDAPGEKVKYHDDVTGQVKAATWSCGISGVENAVRVYSGEDPNEVLGGHKVRSFYNNVSNPHHPDGYVTIDTHAISAAAGRKITAQDPRMDRLTGSPSLRSHGTHGTYPAVADSYRRVAAKHGLTPQQAQAIIWLQWRKEHPGGAEEEGE